MEQSNNSTPQKSAEVQSEGKTPSRKAVGKEKLERTLDIIQNTSVKTKEVYKALTYVRTKILDNPENVKLFQKLDGLNCLLKLLAHGNEDILNVTLSILGNLCGHLMMNEGFREEIVKSKVSSKIVGILRKTNSINIQKRICRLIGNLTQAHAIGRELHSQGVSQAVTQVLTTSEDTEVQHMAIRALRWLWQVDKVYWEMSRCGVIKAVAGHVSSKDPEVEKAALRALAKFTQNLTTSTAEQIIGSGDGYSVIVSKVDQPVVAVVICNLSHDQRARIELCKAGVVPAIIQKLEEGKINSYLISGLCTMCREPMIRASLRLTPTGFPVFLSLLTNKKTKHFYAELLDAITQFNYDQTSLMLMVRHGLIGVLIEKLGEYAKANCRAHSEAVATETMGPMSPQSPTWSWAASPSPPPLSPPLASLSGDYSPRCSTPASDSEDESTALLPPLERSMSIEGGVAGAGLDGSIVEVVSRLTYQGTPMKALAAKNSIVTFLDYITGLSYPRYKSNFVKAKRALTSIVVCMHYWSMLLDDESVLEIHSRMCRPAHQDCWECKRLNEAGLDILHEIGSASAQSGLGEGEMTYRLSGQLADPRLTTALTFPHVIRNPNLLESLLFKYRGLNVLFEALSSRIDEAVPSFHSLFSTLNVKSPQSHFEACPSCEIGSIRKEGNIHFTLDDGSTVAGNKESLSHSCPVFEAMFRGGFKESTQSKVKISDITSSCLTHLLKVLPEYCSCALPKDLPVLLEMISVSDRFLLPDLTTKVASFVRDAALNPATAAQIYDWSVSTGQQYPICSSLPHDVIKYLFAGKMLPSQRVQATAAFLVLESKDLFIQDLSEIIRSSLSVYSKTQMFLQRFSS